MKRNDLFRPLVRFKRRYEEYGDPHKPRTKRAYRKESKREFFYSPIRKADFSQFDSGKYANSGFSKAQLNDSLSNLEKDTFVDWVQEGIQKLNNKKKPIKDKALSSIFSMENLLNSKPKEIIKQIQGSSVFGYGAVQLAKNAVNIVSDLAEINFSRYTRLSEDYMANNSISLVKSAVGQVTSFVSSVGSAAMAGAAVGGLPGAAVSSAIAAATYGIKSWIQTKEAESKFYQTLNASRSQSAFSLQRAGLTDGGRGTEN